MARLPTEPGVYRFRDQRGRCLYIGRATNLRQRVSSYWGDLRDRRHLVRMVPKIDAVEAVACASVHEAAWLERNLLERAKPYWNRVRGGLEVPVFIRLDPEPHVVHMGHTNPDSAIEFGPYLGGTKVRTAVSALHRVLPIAYTATGITGAERDFARVRGIDPRDRDVMRERIAAVLRREPAACARLLADLAARRDAAAGELAFELARRVQDEIEAIEWVTAPQRVTRPAAGTDRLELHGWARGILVTFEIHAGRMDRWQVRPAAAPPQAIASTPPEWTDFVTAAATLAARLYHYSRSS